MLVDLQKEDLINLVRGSHVPYSAMSDSRVTKLGSYSGSYGRWDWNWPRSSCWHIYSEQELYSIYMFLQNNLSGGLV